MDDQAEPAGRQPYLPLSLGLNVLLSLLVAFLWFTRPQVTESPPATALAADVTVATATVTSSAVFDPSPTATTAAPTPTAIAIATATPLPSPTIAAPTEMPSPTIEATATVEPIETAVPSPTVAPVISGPDWLVYFNQIRSEGGLTPVQADAALSQGATNHSEYMLRTNRTVHAQDINSPFYTHDGNQAGINGNIAVSGWAEAPDNWGFDYWMTAPFHALLMLNPRLHITGYGIFRDAASDMKMAATLDVKSVLHDSVESVVYPLTFPKNGGQTWFLESRLPEFPNPLASCPGYVRSVGAPLIVQIGPEDQTPVVTSSSITVDGTAVAHCVLTENTYYNENSYRQLAGRTILAQQNGIILIPRQPLEAGRTYAVNLVVNGIEIAWQFNTVARRPPFEPGN